VFYGDFFVLYVRRAKWAESVSSTLVKHGARGQAQPWFVAICVNVTSYAFRVPITITEKNAVNRLHCGENLVKYP
jgi:hypothetical protein